MKERICLVGYRGTGKTTVGPLLAGKLGWDYFDADRLFEERVGMTIRDYFAQQGEASFRIEERKILAELLEPTRRIVSTGGGIVLREDNRRLLKEKSFVVWLEARPETIQVRLEADPLSLRQRPNLAGGGIEEIRTLLAIRQPLYAEAASLRISTDESFPDRIADTILEAWAGYSSSPKSSY